MMCNPKLLLIDGNNMAHRVFWAHKDFSYRGNVTGVLFGFMKQLVSLYQDFPDHFRIIAWDRGYKRRKKESEEGVRQGIVPEAYKEAREKKRKEADEEAQAKQEELQEQMSQLADMLKLVRCLQVAIEGVEGDDILYSYAKTYRRWGAESVIVSSDQDFYQCIDEGITIYDAQKKQTWNLERFQIEFGFHPSLWVDVGAIQGEVGACLGGDTKVELLDGTKKTMKELSGLGEFWVYSCRPDGMIQPAVATCRKVKRCKTVVVEIDNGEEVICTPDHRFMLRSGEYKEADDLEPGDSLMPLYTRRGEREYLEILDNRTGKWVKCHSLVAKQIHGKDWKNKLKVSKERRRSGKKGEWLVVHHVDFNSDETQIKKQKLGKVHKVVLRAQESFGYVNEESYKECWKRGTMSWANAVSEFGVDIVLGCLVDNHKVVEVREGGVEDVYDLSVSPNENFALEAGIFVHNSKDNIFGVDGWGPVTAVKYVREYGDVDAIIAAFQAKKKRGKKEETFLNSIPRLRLAKSLKRMDIIPQLPKPRILTPLSENALKEAFLEFGFVSLLKEACKLV